MATQLLQDFPELSKLSREDLEDLLADPTYFQATFFSLDKVKVLLKSQAELGTANEALAQRNLALQEELYRLRAETQAAFDDAKALQARWKEVDKEQKDAYSRLTPSFLLMRLRHATTAQDDLSENLASAFVHSQSTGTSTPAGNLGSDSGATTGSGVDVDQFVKEFKEMRKQYHKRAIWSDRWASGKVSWPEE
ncbi:hypothetical protein M407DRAFT_240448 [Tulasnella calospora MUT 4182]|uniref:VPS37 C-terminal domain-containing protein n=1 Tax=Tulasnella calospora MUT 4182 TaxID=1051891 RepID=A0A0C3QX41_9AGAM|nr:hypothetical protein M407DRAFT_240448 [Tulasnella calospora MUT 4182]